MLVVLNPARRKALYQLVCEITAYMHAQLDLENCGSGEQGLEKGWSPQQERDGVTVVDMSENVTASSTLPSRTDDDISVSQTQARQNSELHEVRKAAVIHFDEWAKDFKVRLKEILSKADDTDLLELRQKRKDNMAQVKADTPVEGEDLLKLDEKPVTADDPMQHSADAIEALQSTYHPIPTRLATIPVEDRNEVLSAILILLLSTGSYSAHSRSFITYLASAFGLPLSFLNDEEREIAKTMIEATNEAGKAKQNGQMSAEAEAEKRKQQNKTSRFWKVGLASVAGAALIGVTGGLAAPVVAGAIGGLMGSVGLGGLASFLGIFWMNGALVGTLFGAFGARMTVSYHSSDVCIYPAMVY